MTWNSNRFFTLVGTALLSAGIGASCADNNTSPEDEEDLSAATAQQAIVYDQIELGEGFDTRQDTTDPRYEGTGASCIYAPNKTFTRQPAPEYKISSFYSSLSETSTLELDAAIEGDVQVSEEIGFGVDNGFSAVQTETGEDVMVVFGAEIQTAKEGFGFINFPEDGSVCEQQSLTIDQFLDNCGTKYHSQRYLGGYLLYMFNFESLTVEQKGEIKRNENIGVLAADVELDVQLEAIRTIVGEELEIYVWSRGFANPPVPSEGDIMTVSSLLQWASQLNADSGEAIIRQEFENYSSGVLSECGIGSQLENQLRCSWALFDARDEVNSGSAFLRQLDYIQGAIDQNERFQFNGTTPAEAQVLLDDVALCRQELDNAANQCQAAIDGGNFSNLCSECAIPEDETLSCSDEALKSRAADLVDSIEEIPVFTPSSSTHQEVGQGAAVDFDREAALCTFGGIQGRFEGGGEEFSVIPEVDAQGQAIWTTVADSGRTKKSERISGFVNCTPRSNFFDNNTGTTTPFQTPAYGSLVADDTNNPPAPTTTHVTALSGLTGRLAGGAEYGLVDDQNGDVKANSNQGYLEAGFTSFGPDRSTGGAPLEASYNFVDRWEYDTVQQDHKTDIKLPNSEAAHCYITELGGQFDGRGEYAKIVIEEDGHWHLKVRSSDKSPKRVKVAAECIAFNQT